MSGLISGFAGMKSPAATAALRPQGLTSGEDQPEPAANRPGRRLLARSLPWVHRRRGEYCRNPFYKKALNSHLFLLQHVKNNHCCDFLPGPRGQAGRDRQVHAGGRRRTARTSSFPNEQP